MKDHYKAIERQHKALLMIGFAVTIAMTFLFGKLI
jgi:hypothetical protein